MGKSMDEKLRWLIEYLKETGREEQEPEAVGRDLHGRFPVVRGFLLCGEVPPEQDSRGGGGE